MKVKSFSYYEALGACALTAGLACSAGSSGGGGLPQAQGGGKGGTVSLGAGDGGAGAALGVGGLGAAGAPPVWAYADKSYKDPSLPDDVKDYFAGPAVQGGSIVYPLAGSMHPMNLGDLTLQWRRSDAAHTAFRVDLTVGAETYYLYVPCTPAGNEADACTSPVPVGEWLDLGERFAGQELTMTVSGSSGAGASVSTTPPLTITFSPEAVLGGLYYWSTSEHAIKRASFGSAKAVPFITPESATSEFSCVACHSVSRDGKTIAFAAAEPNGESAFYAAGIQIAPTAAPEQPYLKPTRGVSPAGVGYPRTPGTTEAQDQFGDNVALNPNGTIAVINGAVFDMPPNEKYIELRDARTGAQLAIYPVYDERFGGKLPIHPEWSPDGSAIAVTLADPYGNCQWTFFSCSSSIAVIPFDKATKTLGNAVIVTQPATGVFDFYPTWSPDGKYLAFISAPMPPLKTEGDPAIGSSSGNEHGIIRLVRAEGGPYTCPSADCVDLTNGTTYTAEQAFSETSSHASTWPKFTPFAQGLNDNIMFISFTSHVSHGFLSARAPSRQDEPSRNYAQIWMFAVDIAKFGVSDPSTAPFWVPYQLPTDGSLTPYWTEILPCQSDSQGGCRGCAGGESCLVDAATNTCQCASIVK